MSNYTGRGDMDQKNKAENRFRWAELFITVVVSTATTAIAVSWSVSATMTAMRKDVDTLKAAQDGQTATISNLSSQASLHTTQIAVNDTRYNYIILSLSEIKEEIKRRK